MTDTLTLDFIRAQANMVADPCALSNGVAIGLQDMGLVKNVQLQPIAGGEGAGVNVLLEMRLTSPECMYALYFERELRERLVGQRGIVALTFDWGSPFEWFPELMTPAAREALATRRDQKIALMRPVAKHTASIPEACPSSNDLERAR